MNTIWSENVQGIMTLYLSRKLRFDDIFFANYKDLFNIDQQKSLKILEIGCGPGALAEALHRWYPNAQITGIDRDTKFIEFAKDNFGVEMEKSEIVCSHSAQNNQCIGKRCPFSKANRGISSRV